MTIEPVIETGWTATSFRDVITAGRRLLLRPHGRSEGDCYRGVGDYWVFNRAAKLSQSYFNTRAQAAQAAAIE